VKLVPTRLGLQQRMLPFYRVPFFEELALSCEGGLGVYAGTPRPEEAVEVRTELEQARFTLARNYHIFRGPLYTCWQSNILDWLDTWQPEVLIVEANPRYLHTPAALRWMKARQRPVIGWGLGTPNRGGFWNVLKERQQHRFLDRFDAMIAYSQQGAEEYQDSGFPREKIFVAPNAVSHRPQGVCPKRTEDYPDGRGRLLFVGRLQARKRVDLLIRACASLPGELQPDLWIVGDGPERRDLEALADSKFPGTKFFGTQIGSRLDELFTKADLFVLPGTGGLAIQQAMSFGLPVIAAEADGTQNDLVSADNGWRLPQGELSALGRILKEALTDVSGLRKKGKESFRIVQNEINLENMVRIFGAVVKSVMEN
jgi:glycosyltransferase involved in cell wall biosynthesis